MRSQVISEQPPVAGGLVPETKWNTIMFIESCFDTCGNAQSMFNPLQSWSLISHISWYLIMSHVLSTLRCCSLILICQLLTWSSHGRNAPASLSAILSMHWASRGSWVDLLTSFDCQTVSDCQMRKPWWKEKRWWKLSDLTILQWLCGQTLFFLLLCSVIGGQAWGFSLAVSTMPQWTMTCKIQGKSTRTHYYRCVIDV